MKNFKTEKNKLLELTTGGNCYYPQMKILVYPVSIRVVYFSAKLGIHPNLLSIVGIFLSLACLLFFQFRIFGLALLFYWARTVIDYSDGALARYTNKETKLGGYLDGITDKLFFITIWILITLQCNTLAGKAFFFFTCIAYLLIVQFFVMPRMKYLRKRAVVKQFFIDRGILFGMGAFIELEFWVLVFFVIGLAPTYLWILILLTNLDLIYRIYEVVRYYEPGSLSLNK